MSSLAPLCQSALDCCTVDNSSSPACLNINDIQRGILDTGSISSEGSERYCHLSHVLYLKICGFSLLVNISACQRDGRGSWNSAESAERTDV
jgi:hypothetical protein